MYSRIWFYFFCIVYRKIVKLVIERRVSFKHQKLIAGRVLHILCSLVDKRLKENEEGAGKIKCI